MKQHRFDKTFQTITEAVSDVYSEGVNSNAYWVEYRVLSVPYKGQIQAGKQYGSHVTAKDEKSVSIEFAKDMSLMGFKPKHYKIISIIDKDSEEYEKSLFKAPRKKVI